MNLIFTCAILLWSGLAAALPRVSDGEAMMVALVIDLQAGFAADTVVVTVGGREVFHKTAVETDYSLGRADSVEMQIPQGSTNIEVAVPSRGQVGAITLDVVKSVYLGVSIGDGGIEFHPSDQPFTYF